MDRYLESASIHVIKDDFDISFEQTFNFLNLSNLFYLKCRNPDSPTSLKLSDTVRHL